MLLAEYLRLGSLVLVASFLPTQSHCINITKSTRWRDTQEAKIIHGSVKFKPESDLGGGVRECAKIVIDMSFRNESERPIRQIDVEVVLYANKSHDGQDSTAQPPRREEFNFKSLIPVGGTGRRLHEITDCNLFFPVRQTVRIIRILFEDGSVKESQF